MSITNKKTYFYNLPQELIAQAPAEPRDHSNLLVYNKNTKQVEDKKFYDIISYLKPNDVLVVNNTKVIPARLFGKKQGHTAKCEVFLLKRLDLNNWECLIKPAKRFKVGTVIEFSENLSAKVVSELEDGKRQLEFYFNGVFEEVLQSVGNVPLPHYINKPNYKNLSRYNTVYSKIDGSSAAPTAGLHFTPELLQKIEDKGVKVVEVLLHVGLGTFRPVKEDDILKHIMHSEYLELTEESANIINKTKELGGRVVAVGTTSIRVLESCADENGVLTPQKKETDIFIYPGYKFKVVDAIITNFHLPESTLIMLISAFMGTKETLNVYNYAVSKKYRFFSFGDSMFIS